MANEFFTTANFLHKYGYPKFQTFCEMMNSGKSLKEMSDAIGLSMSQLSRYRDAMFECRFIPKQGTANYLKEFAYQDKLRAERKDEFRLVLLQGMQK